MRTLVFTLLWWVGQGGLAAEDVFCRLGWEASPGTNVTGYWVLAAPVSRFRLEGTDVNHGTNGLEPPRAVVLEDEAGWRAGCRIVGVTTGCEWAVPAGEMGGAGRWYFSVVAVSGTNESAFCNEVCFEPVRVQISSDWLVSEEASGPWRPWTNFAVVLRNPAGSRFYRATMNCRVLTNTANEKE